jgi:hypothetical protein
MLLKIEIDELKERGLLVAEYLVLFQLYYYVNIKHLTIDEEIYKSLEDKNYIRQREDSWVLLDVALDLFEPREDMFTKFIEAFPTRAHNKTGETRVLSPASSTTNAGKKLQKKWISLTKGKPELQEHIIKCLEKEVELREKDGNLYYMRNVETWLNNYTWESYEYLLTEGVKETNARDLRL